MPKAKWQPGYVPIERFIAAPLMQSKVQLFVMRTHGFSTAQSRPPLLSPSHFQAVWKRPPCACLDPKWQASQTSLMSCRSCGCAYQQLSGALK
jgi:hypothetical protein